MHSSLSLRPPGGNGKPHKPACLNLQERFGRRFRVTWDESYWAERPEFQEAEAPWLMMIPCQRGSIGPWDENHLLACTRTVGPSAKALKAVAGARVHQDGMDGANVIFPVEAFDEVASIMKPRRRRVLSPEARERLRAAGQATRYLPHNPGTRDAPERLGIVCGALVDG